jgi:hypothetical protein
MRWWVDEIAYALEDFGPKIVFWQNSEVGDANCAARANWKPEGNWICHDGCAGEDNYEALIAQTPSEMDFAPVETSTPLLGIYTAGFSGKLGAALLSHESLIIIAWLAMASQAIDENSGYLVSDPCFIWAC